MFFDYFGDVFGLDLAVEDAVGVDHNGDADGAEADRAALSEEDLAHWVAAFLFFALTNPLFFEDAGEFGEDFFAADLRAGFACADKDLPFDRRLDHRGELFELFAVGNEFRLSHNY